MAKSKDPVEYRALEGFNYPDPTGEEGEEVRVEAGDKLPVLLDDDWVQAQVNKGLIEVWESGETGNVIKDEDREVTVTGVTSRHKDGEIVLKEVNSDAR